MEDPFILRSLIFALIEFTLAIYIWRHGVFARKWIVALLVFLGGYQLGEFIYLATGNTVGLQIAIFSTSLLPPIGLMLLQRITGRYYFADAVGTVAVILGTFFLLVPDQFHGTPEAFCLVKYAALTQSSNTIILVWGAYYTLTLTSSMLIILYNLFDKRMQSKRKVLLWVLLMYASFFPMSYLLTLLFSIDLQLLTSFMCALALGAAFIAAWLGVKYEVLVERQ